MNLHKLFYVTVYTFKFNKHSEYGFEDVGKLNRHPEGWRCDVNSSFPNIRNDDPMVSVFQRENLKRDLKFQLMELFYEKQLPDRFEFREFWYNVYHKNQNQERHSHLMGCGGVPYWCGIYYHKGFTPTTFYRPDYHNTVHSFPINGSELSDYKSSIAKPKLNDGDVILFPPYVEHCVDENLSDDIRITFSFNLFIPQ